MGDHEKGTSPIINMDQPETDLEIIFSSSCSSGGLMKTLEDFSLTFIESIRGWFRDFRDWFGSRLGSRLTDSHNSKSSHLMCYRDGFIKFQSARNHHSVSQLKNVLLILLMNWLPETNRCSPGRWMVYNALVRSRLWLYRIETSSICNPFNAIRLNAARWSSSKLMSLLIWLVFESLFESLWSTQVRVGNFEMFKLEERLAEESKNLITIINNRLSAVQSIIELWSSI